MILLARLSRIALVAATIAAPLPAGAQCFPGGPANPAAVKGSLVGIVLDRSNQPLENADVYILNPRRAARTRADGRFQLSDLDTGTYQVVVRKIGYAITSRNYNVPDSGGVARFCLIQEVRILPPTITSVKGGGLSGFVTDSLRQPLPGAEVRILGAGESAITDTAGAFHIDVKRGTYPVTVSKSGFGRQLLSVTIPKDSGREIAVFMGSPARNANRMAANMESMHERLLMAAPSSSGIMSSEELMDTKADLRAASQRLARVGVADDCPAIIDGGPYSLPVSLIDKRDVAMLEVYAISAPRRAGQPQRPLNGRCAARIYVWMKP